MSDTSSTPRGGQSNNRAEAAVIVAMPFDAITIAVTDNAIRTLTVNADKRELEAAPDFAATEKTTLDSVTDLAALLGNKAASKVVQIKEQAIKAVEGLSK